MDEELGTLWDLYPDKSDYEIDIMCEEGLEREMENME